MSLATTFVRCACLVLAMLLAQAGPVFAATYVVDDTSTIPYETNLVSRWRQGASGRQLGNDIEAAAMVTVRLNVAPWLNRNGRIYLALPQQPIGVVTVDWATQGRLLPGTLRSGERTLVYTGPIRTPIIEDNFQLKVVADGRRVALTQRLQFRFEIDID
ncbi:MAG: hypothetical protein ABI569_14280 [Casimicrobiaceae bacterium]